MSRIPAVFPWGVHPGHLWAAAAGVRAWLYRHGAFSQERLPAKVISVGNIAWGGTGKTPLTMWLAGRLQACGLRVSILTRGYRRTSREPVRVLPPDTSADQCRDLGDEVQLYLRHLEAPVGVSASRFQAGRLLEEQFPVDVHLLDDGFQHLGLARDLDLVLVDARNPWGGRRGLKVLLRESPSALSRAHCILLTRCELLEADKNGGDSLRQLRSSLQMLSPKARLVNVRTRLLHFVEEQGRVSRPCDLMRGQRAVAFCGLGNHNNFFDMLMLHGIAPVAQKLFPDHHRYAPNDVALLEEVARSCQADSLITTEKDVVNLPQDCWPSVPVYWAAIEPVIEEGDRFLSWLVDQLGFPLDRLKLRADPAEPVGTRFPAGDSSGG